MVWNDGPVRVWRKRDQRYHSDFTGKSSKNQVGLMCWLCIASNGSSRLVLCDDRQDSASYQHTILTPNLSFIRQIQPSRHPKPIIFQQDGASSHTSRSTTNFLASHRVKTMSDWPSMSPDLNLVENCWGYIAKELVGHTYTNKDHLWKAIQRVWANRPPTLIPNLCQSMVRRLTAVQVARGGHTRY